MAALLALLAVHWGCVSNRQPAEVAARQGEVAAHAAPVTLADASAACDRVQANSQIPVSCTTEHVDEVPSMIVGFRNADDVAAWLAPFAREIGEPFCAAANRNGREARIYVTIGVGPDRRARRWSCELGKWSAWFHVEPTPPAAARPRTIADAIAACNDVQANARVPVSCTTRDVDGVPAIIVGFPSRDDVQAYMKDVAERVAGPFCDAANRANRRASFFITLGNSRARHYDCEQQRWSEWFELSQREAAVPNRL